jgi:TPR repeat protein
LNELQACSLLGADDDLVKAHPEQGRFGLQKACTAGQQDACDQVGLLLAQGKLGYMSPTEEVALAQLACETGRRSKQVLKVHQYACVAYGNALWEGHTIAQDRRIALQILSASCEDALVPAQMQIDCYTRVGRAHRDGEATSQDLEQATAHFSRACSLSGTAEACLEYADACDDSLFGYQRDGDQEPECYAPACRAGSAAACETMGGYFQGWDQWEKAAKAYGAAVALGAEGARPRLEEVVVKLGRQGERDRVHAAAAIDGLLAQCRNNRSKFEQARVALFSARSRVDIEGMGRAVGELKNLDGPWSETLTKLQDAVAVASNGSADERVRLLLLVDEHCNCRPTTTGHCR